MSQKKGIDIKIKRNKLLNEIIAKTSLENEVDIQAQETSAIPNRYSKRGNFMTHYSQDVKKKKNEVILNVVIENNQLTKVGIIITSNL